MTSHSAFSQVAFVKQIANSRNACGQIRYTTTLRITGVPIFSRQITRCDQVIIDFLTDTTMTEAAGQVLMVGKRPWSQCSRDVLRQMTGLHLAAYFGVYEAVHHSRPAGCGTEG